MSAATILVYLYSFRSTFVGSCPDPDYSEAAVYGSSPEGAAAVSGWLERYNYRRHGALGHRPSIERPRELQGNNVAGIYN